MNECPPKIVLAGRGRGGILPTHRERGPAPAPCSGEHAKRCSEISVRGGRITMGRCAYTPSPGLPEWFVNGRPVDQQLLLIELLKDRGIDHTQKELAAKVSMDYLIGYYIRGVLLTKPEYWSRSEVLKQAKFVEPFVELIENPTEQSSSLSRCYKSDLTVARVTCWVSKDRQTSNYRRRGGQVVAIGSSPVCWKVWELQYYDVLVSMSSSAGQYYYEKVGYIKGSGRMKSINPCAMKTTPDGLSPFTGYDPSFFC